MKGGPTLGSKVESGRLLPLARMVEATWEDEEDVVARVCTSRRIPYDRCLLTALVDRWRPETHTFHLPCGEITSTLQDVGYLTGLPYTGFPLLAYDVPETWRTKILARFQGLLPAKAGYREFTSTHGPTLKWINQFNLAALGSDAPEHTVRRYFEVYLLWLFGWVMFLGAHSDNVDKHMIRYARELAYLEVEAIPPYAWGLVVLCTDYRVVTHAVGFANSSESFTIPLLRLQRSTATTSSSSTCPL